MTIPVYGMRAVACVLTISVRGDESRLLDLLIHGTLEGFVEPRAFPGDVVHPSHIGLNGDGELVRRIRWEAEAFAVTGDQFNCHDISFLLVVFGHEKARLVAGLVVVLILGDAPECLFVQAAASAGWWSAMLSEGSMLITDGFGAIRFKESSMSLSAKVVMGTRSSRAAKYSRVTNSLFSAGE